MKAKDIRISKNRLIIDTFITLIIICLPFLFFTYKLIPDSKVWKTPLFELDSNYFESARDFVWFLMLKVLTLTILSVWFITCKKKWRFVLLVPIYVEVHKTFNVYNSLNIGAKYDPDIFDSFFYCFSYLLALVFISEKIGYYKSESNYHELVNNEINDEILNQMSSFQIKRFDNLRDEYEELKQTKNKLSKKEYLAQLIELRDKVNI